MHYDKVMRILLKHGMTEIPAKVSDTNHGTALTNIFQVTILYYDTHINAYVDESGIGWKYAIAIMQIPTNTIKQTKKERL